MTLYFESQWLQTRKISIRTAHQPRARVPLPLASSLMRRSSHQDLHRIPLILKHKFDRPPTQRLSHGGIRKRPSIRRREPNRHPTLHEPPLIRRPGFGHQLTRCHRAMAHSSGLRGNRELLLLSDRRGCKNTNGLTSRSAMRKSYRALMAVHPLRSGCQSSKARLLAATNTPAWLRSTSC